MFVQTGNQMMDMLRLTLKGVCSLHALANVSMDTYNFCASSDWCRLGKTRHKHESHAKLCLSICASQAEGALFYNIIKERQFFVFIPK